MQAIQIPNANLLDVFGKTIAINNQDLQHSSITLESSGSPNKQEPGERLTVVGQ